MPDIAFVKPALPKTGILVLPLTEGDPPAGLAQQADGATGGLLTRALDAAGFKGRKGQSTTLWALGPWTKVIAVGLGKAADLGADGMQAAVVTRFRTVRVPSSCRTSSLGACAGSPQRPPSLRWPGCETSLNAHHRPSDWTRRTTSVTSIA